MRTIKTKAKQRGTDKQTTVVIRCVDGVWRVTGDVSKYVMKQIRHKVRRRGYMGKVVRDG